MFRSQGEDQVIDSRCMQVFGTKMACLSSAVVPSHRKPSDSLCTNALPATFEISKPC